jgi:hypothetical protein
VPYGTLTHEAYRENWAGSASPHGDSFGRSIASAPQQQAATGIEEGFQGVIQSSSAEGAVIDTDSVQPYTFHKVTGFSTKRQYRPCTGLNRTYWPALGIWAEQPDGKR